MYERVDEVEDSWRGQIENADVSDIADFFLQLLQIRVFDIHL